VKTRAKTFKLPANRGRVTIRPTGEVLYHPPRPAKKQAAKKTPKRKAQGKRRR
jgi:hypothetical protein